MKKPKAPIIKTDPYPPDCYDKRLTGVNLDKFKALALAIDMECNIHVGKPFSPCGKPQDATFATYASKPNRLNHNESVKMTQILVEKYEVVHPLSIRYEPLWSMCDFIFENFKNKLK